MKVIALHGAGMRPGVWDLLAKEIPLEALALPPADTIEKKAAVVGARLKSDAADSVLLLGHSMGALVALAAAKHEAVAKIVLIGAAEQMPVHPDLLRQAKKDPAAAAALILKWGVPKENTAATDFLRERMDPSALFTDLSACAAARAALSPKPALVLAGSGDKLVTAAASAALAAALPRGTFAEIAGAGHMLMAEKPAEIANEIRAFTGVGAD